MSSFTESALVKKLMELNTTQESIQTLSLWLIHHRKHHGHIVRIWFKELVKAPVNKKLTFMFLANDVIQNSKKKGPEYGKEFGRTLDEAFKHIREFCSKEIKTLNSLDRILKIWEDRNVYDTSLINVFKKTLSAEPSNNGNSKGEDSHHEKKRRSGDVSASSKRAKISAREVNGTVETLVTLSPHTSFGDPPEPEELIKALQVIENSASSDVAVRQKIANLPLELSEVSMLNKLEDKEAAQKLAREVNDALKLLNEYNARLCREMDDRKKLQTMLKDFAQEQRELMSQAESRLEEYTKKMTKLKDVQKEIRNHLQNLPDLKQLPDVTGGLAPLPSAGDLFNSH